MGNAGGGSNSDWVSGVFEDYNTFYARCESPRSGTNPATNSPYPDVQGTTTDENNFLRSYSNDTYLWYSEITDRDPGLYSDPLAYFDLLKTTAMTPSGQPKDKFHFTYPSDAWYQLSQSGVESAREDRRLLPDRYEFLVYRLLRKGLEAAGARDDDARR